MRQSRNVIEENWIGLSSSTVLRNRPSTVFFTGIGLTFKHMFVEEVLHGHESINTTGNYEKQKPVLNSILILCY